MTTSFIYLHQKRVPIFVSKKGSNTQIFGSSEPDTKMFQWPWLHSYNTFGSILVWSEYLVHLNHIFTQTFEHFDTIRPRYPNILERVSSPTNSSSIATIKLDKSIVIIRHHSMGMIGILVIQTITLLLPSLMCQVLLYVMVLPLMQEEITGYTNKPSPRHLSANSSDTLKHLEYVPPRHAFSNTSKIDTVYKANNWIWQGINHSITMAKNRELFETDFIVQDEHSQVDSTRVNIQVNKHYMTELLDNTKVLCLFDTGSNFNLFSESVIKSSEYLSSIPIQLEILPVK